MTYLSSVCVYIRNDVQRREMVHACESNDSCILSDVYMSRRQNWNMISDVINSEIPTTSLSNGSSYTYLANGRRRTLSNTTSLLNIASQFSGVQMVDFLLANGADVKYADENNENALHEACKSKLDVSRKVRLLLQSHAGLMRQKTRLARLLPVHMAARNTDPAGLEVLLMRDCLQINGQTKQGLTPLHIATSFGLVDNVRVLLSRSAIDVNAQDRFGFTPAHTAAHANNVDCFLAILEQDSYNPYIKDCRGNKPDEYFSPEIRIKLYIEKCKFEQFSQFLKLKHRNLNILNCDRYGNSLLHLACKSDVNPCEKLKFLRKVYPELILSRNRHRKLPLHIASANGNKSLLESAIEATIASGGSLTSPDKDGMTPLHIASKHMLCSNVDVLLHHAYIDVNAQDIHGNTPAHYAAMNGDMDSLEILMSHPKYISEALNNHLKSVDDVNAGKIELLARSRFGTAKSLFTLMHPICLEAKDEYGNNALHLACSDSDEYRAEDKIKLLLKHCPALLTASNVEGDFPILIAAKNCTASTLGAMRELEECDINVINTQNGNNALHLACTDPDRDRACGKLQLLLMHDPTLLTKCNNSDEYPLHLAAKCCSQQAVKSMLASHVHCQLNAVQPATGRTALHLAVLHNSDDVVTTLINDINIDINVVDKRGDTVVLAAYRMKRYSLARTMERHMGYRRVFPHTHQKTLEEVCHANRLTSDLSHSLSLLG